MTHLATTGLLALPSRRGWLKGLGAALGAGLLAAPARLLARPTPTPAEALALAGGTEYIGLAKLFAGPQLPPGWVVADGRLLAIAEHPALFAVLGATYGGDGHRTFALPQLIAHADEPALAGAPVWLPAVKVANAAATSHALAELRLPHQRRPTRLAAAQPA